MKKKIVLSLAFTVSFIAVFLGGYYRGVSQTVSPINEYYIHTEALLDTIYNQDSAYFDVLMETDVYYYYEVAKDNLNYK